MYIDTYTHFDTEYIMCYAKRQTFLSNQRDNMSYLPLPSWNQRNGRFSLVLPE